MKPTAEELKMWNERLEAAGLGDPDEPWRDHVRVSDTDGVRIPAQPVRDGGIFWAKRAEIVDAEQDRKKVTPTSNVCAACGSEFLARKGSRFCSKQCRQRVWVAAKRVDAKLPSLSEEKQS